MLNESKHCAGLVCAGVSACRCCAGLPSLSIPKGLRVHLPGHTGECVTAPVTGVAIEQDCLRQTENTSWVSLSCFLDVATADSPQVNCNKLSEPSVRLTTPRLSVRQTLEQVWRALQFVWTNPPEPAQCIRSSQQGRTMLSQVRWVSVQLLF